MNSAPSMVRKFPQLEESCNNPDTAHASVFKPTFHPETPSSFAPHLAGNTAEGHLIPRKLVANISISLKYWDMREEELKYKYRVIRWY